MSIPATQPLLEDVLRRDPLVLDQSLEDQFQKLLVAPVSALAETVPSMTIIVDALDECDDGDLAASFIEIVTLAAGVRQLEFVSFHSDSSSLAESRSIFERSSNLA